MPQLAPAVQSSQEAGVPSGDGGQNGSIWAWLNKKRDTEWRNLHENMDHFGSGLNSGIESLCPCVSYLKLSCLRSNFLDEQ